MATPHIEFQSEMPQSAHSGQSSSIALTYVAVSYKFPAVQQHHNAQQHAILSLDPYR